MSSRGRLITLLQLVVLLTPAAGVLAADEPTGKADSPRPGRLTDDQQRQLQEADRHLKEGNALLAAGTPGEAVEEAEKALAIRRQVLGPDHERVVQLLLDLARMLERSGDKPAAGKHLQEVIAIREKRWGKDHWRVTDARLQLHELELRSSLSAERRRQWGDANRLSHEVAALSKQGRSAAAIPSALKACDAYKAVLGERDPNYARSLNKLAGLYRDTGEYDKALPLLLEACDINKAVLGERHPHYASTLGGLAGLYRDTGAYTKALPLYLEASRLFKAALGERNPDYAQSLYSLAGLYDDMGETAKEVPLLQEAIAITKVSLGPRDPEHAQGLNNLAKVFHHIGAYRKALALYLEARDILKASVGERHPFYGASLNSLATLYQDMGDHDRALPLLLEALEITKASAGQHNAEYARNLNNLAVYYRDARDYAKALPLFLEARDLRKSILGERHSDYAVTLNHMAELYMDTGEYAKALPLFLEARDVWKAALGDRNYKYAISLRNLAVAYQHTGDYAKALPLLLEARDVTKAALGDRHPVYATILHNLAQQYDATGDAEKARSLYRESFRISLYVVDRAADGQAERQQVIMARRMHVYLDFYLSLLTRKGLPAAEGYPAVLDVKGVALARNKWDRMARSSDPEAARLAERLRSASGQLAARSLATPPPQQQSAWRQELGALEEERERLEQRLAARSATYRAVRVRHWATVEEVREALSDGTAVVDFLEYKRYSPPPAGKGHWQYEPRLMAFVLRRGQPVAAVELGPIAPIAQAVADWRRPMESASVAPVDDEAARNLTRLLWRPLLPHLEAATTVLISPDGALCGFPFAALPGVKPGSYLIEERAIGYLPSAREVLAVGEGHDRPAAGLLALGDADYGERPPASPGPGPRRPFYGPLPGTRPEMERVAAAYEAAFTDQVRHKLLTGAAANAAALKQELNPADDRIGYRFVHLACHGFFERLPPAPSPDQISRDLAAMDTGGGGPRGPVLRDPLFRSGLVLAGANRSPEAGTLTASEVAGLDLRGCEMAVLSACQTGLGGVQAGEGVLGLQRAFNEAGVRTLVASLWSVNDAGTSVLMEEFYANLWAKKLPKLEALRQAQLTVLRHPERVARRAEELRGELAKRGVPAGVLASRGYDWKEEDLPKAAQTGAADNSVRRSHPALWAAFVSSGEYR